MWERAIFITHSLRKFPFALRNFPLKEPRTHDEVNNDHPSDEVQPPVPWLWESWNDRPKHDEECDYEGKRTYYLKHTLFLWRSLTWLSTRDDNLGHGWELAHEIVRNLMGEASRLLAHIYNPQKVLHMGKIGGLE